MQHFISLNIVFCIFCVGFINAGVPSNNVHANHTVIGEEINTTNLGLTGNLSDSLTSLLPKEWKEFCKADYKFVYGSNFTGQPSVYISCDLKTKNKWSLQDYRGWITRSRDMFLQNIPENSNLLVAFELKCSDREAVLSLPWPIRAPYLWYVTVDGCTITDYLAEYDVVHPGEDVLKVLEIINSDIKTDELLMFEFMTNFVKQSPQFDCGGENLERFVQRNVTKSFTTGPSDGTQSSNTQTQTQTFNLKRNTRNNTQNTFLENLSKLQFSDYDHSMGTNQTIKDMLPLPVENPQMTEAKIIEDIARVGQDNQKIENHCNYRYMRYIDESHSHAVSKHHSHFMVERMRYPVLQYYNMSYSQLKELPTMLLQWRRYFPKMKYVDLSHNKIKYFKTFSDHGLKTDGSGVLDLRHNNITTLTRDDIEALRLHSRTVFVDIRENPFVCDCKLEYLVSQLKNVSFEVLTKYKYMRNLTCTNPPRHRGKLIATLEKGFCETLTLMIMSAPLIVLSSMLVLFIISVVISVRYRKEIVILAFTRLHISLPCRKIIINSEKKYDAFIAYSEQDSSWVFHSLLPRLEEPCANNGPGLKLCIHHRDFPIGGCITDNILDKVKDSHHTVLMLSNNFLRSHWCKYEFKTAFTQSLMEKKQHLIMVLLEDLDKRLIDQALKRCLKTFTYVKVDDKLFWDKIIFALSDNVKKSSVDVNYNSKHSCSKSTSDLSSSTPSRGTISSSGQMVSSDSTINSVTRDHVWYINEAVHATRKVLDAEEVPVAINTVNMNQNGYAVQVGTTPAQINLSTSKNVKEGNSRVKVKRKSSSSDKKTCGRKKSDDQSEKATDKNLAKHSKERKKNSREEVCASVEKYKLGNETKDKTVEQSKGDNSQRNYESAFSDSGKKPIKGGNSEHFELSISQNGIDNPNYLQDGVWKV